MESLAERDVALPPPTALDEIPKPRDFLAFVMIKVEPATPTVAVLIGRDILKHGTLLFDGENEAFGFWF